MCIYRCNDCNEATFPNGGGLPPQCAHCGSARLTDDHTGGEFDKARQAFVCSNCGQEFGNDDAFVRLRELAKSGAIPDLRGIIDCTDH